MAQKSLSDKYTTLHSWNESAALFISGQTGVVYHRYTFSVCVETFFFVGVGVGVSVCEEKKFDICDYYVPIV